MIVQKRGKKSEGAWGKGQLVQHVPCVVFREADLGNTVCVVLVLKVRKM